MGFFRSTLKSFKSALIGFLLLPLICFSQPTYYLGFRTGGFTINGVAYNIGTIQIYYYSDSLNVYFHNNAGDSTIPKTNRNYILQNSSGLPFSSNQSLRNFYYTYMYSPYVTSAVTYVSAGNLSPLFTTGVSNPSTTPNLTFAPVSQSANLFYCSPDGLSGNPTFRAIVPSDIPSIATYATTVQLADTGNVIRVHENVTFYLQTNPSSYISRTGISAGTGISYNSSTGVITNSSPDLTLTLNAGTGIGVSGAYPSFTVTNSSPSSGGTLTSFAALSLNPIFTVGVSNPITTPSLSFALISQSANTFFAAPSSGSGNPGFRTIASNDYTITTSTPMSNGYLKGVSSLGTFVTSIPDGDISSSSNWNTAYSNRITSLTTAGASGASTLSSNTLNIPNYTLAGLGGISLSSLSGTSPILYNSGTGAISFDYTQIGTFTAGQNIIQTGLGTISTNSLLIGNTTASTSLNPAQYSGDIRFGMTAYNTSAVASQAVSVNLHPRAISSSAISAGFDVQASTNGSAFANVWSFSGGSTTITGNCTVGSTLTSILGIVSTGRISPNLTAVTVNCSTSGSVQYKQCFNGTGYSEVLAWSNACLGTASFTYSTAMTNTPMNETGSALITSISNTTMTITGTGTTTFVGVKGW